MPLMEIHLIENVFNPEQKRQIIQKLTDAMVSIEGENMRGVSWVKISEVTSGEMGHRRPAADHRSEGSRSGPKRGVRPVRVWRRPAVARPICDARLGGQTAAIPRGCRSHATRHRIAASVRCRRRRYSLILSITSSWRNRRGRRSQICVVELES